MKKPLPVLKWFFKRINAEVHRKMSWKCLFHVNVPPDRHVLMLAVKMVDYLWMFSERDQRETFRNHS